MRERQWPRPMGWELAEATDAGSRHRVRYRWGQLPLIILKFAALREFVCFWDKNRRGNRVGMTANLDPKRKLISAWVEGDAGGPNI